MRYASLALRILSRLDLMSSKGIRSMSEALWSLERKCSETVVGLELFVCLSGLRCSLKRSLVVVLFLLCIVCGSGCSVPCK